MNISADHLFVQEDFQFLGYTQIEPLYQGPRTVVYRAWANASAQSVVIKYLNQEHPSVGELVQFRNQYTITRNLFIPGIVNSLALEAVNNSYALIMEDVGGVSLSRYVQQQALDLEEILAIAIQLANILHDLHQQRVIHKDIKPANILIHPDSKQVWLIDFSIASLLPKESQTVQSPKQLEGTLAYLAPEQTGRMNRAIDYRTDFYSLGVTLYELLTGQLPFSSDDPLALIHCHMAQNPPAIALFNPQVPSMVVAIASKLMAKNAEDRYQSALGLKYDLEQCLRQWHEQGEISEFTLGQGDLSDRFIIPEKLYGRDADVQTLLEAFDRISEGSSELMLVAGFSGIGKTAVINEIHKPILRQRGYFIKGKFDQFNRNIPFSAFVQAFRDLVGQLLGESDADLAQWQAKILDAVGVNGQVILDVIPNLKPIIGDQPPLAKLSGSAALNRFKLVFSKFVQVFTTKEHPLVLFLDDLQWADLASLNLLKQLMDGTESEETTGHLLVVGAYRDNEVFAAHPLMLTVEGINKHAAVTTLTLAPLTPSNITQLVADTLLCSGERAEPLAQLIYQKTQGNPFFTRQVLQGLEAQGYSQFDRDAGCWHVDLSQVQQLSLTDDVVAFMVGRLQQLPPDTQEILTLAACIGNRVDLDILAVVCERSPDEVAKQLWSALQAGFIVPESEHYKFFYGDCTPSPLEHCVASPIENQTLGKISADIAASPIPHQTQPTIIYRFAHDRIQQSAYLLLSDEAKITTHATIGQLLLENTPADQLEEVICDIVSHLNVSVERLHIEDDIRTLIQLNLQAADKMFKSTGYSTALACMQTALKLLEKLGDDAWTVDHPLALQLHERVAELAYLSADFDLMESYILAVKGHAKSPLEKFSVYKTKIQFHAASGQPLLAVTTAIEILQTLGADITLHPSSSEIEALLSKTQTALGDKTIDDLLKLPHNRTPEQLAIIEILGAVHAQAFFAAPQLIPIEICTRINICLDHGNSPESAHTYADYGLLRCGVFNDIETGYQFGQLALAITEQFPQSGTQARGKIVHYLAVAHWKDSLRQFLDDSTQAYQEALDSGDWEFAAYGAFIICVTSFLAGINLEELQPTIDTYCRAIANLHQQSQLGWSQIYGQTVAKLLTDSDPAPWILTDLSFDETELSNRLHAESEGYGLFILYNNKMLLAYLFGEWALAKEYADITQSYVPSVTSMVMQPSFFFYDSLVQLELCILLTHPDSHTKGDASEVSIGEIATVQNVLNNLDLDTLLERVATNQEKLKLWGAHAPTNYQHKYELVEARRAACLQQYAEAIEGYDRAIASARSHQYLQEEALTNELAARFYLGWGKEKIAASYLQDAYYAYSRWGATAKLADLERRYPELLRPLLQPTERANSMWKTPLTTITEPKTSVHTTTRHGSNLNQILDFSSALQASQTLSSTVQLDELLRQLTQLILQTSGGDRCALILPRDASQTQESLWEVRAIAECSHGEVAQPPTVTLCAELLSPQSNLPIQLIHYVKRTREAFVSNAVALAIKHSQFPVVDEYLNQHPPNSILCLPLMHQNTLVGIMYVQNQFAQEAFTDERLDILTVLSTQAAISLENATLYHRLKGYNQRLEEQVAERTQSLQSNNVQLQQTLHQLQQTQAHLIQAEQMSALGKMVSGIAHEINNPNNFISGNLEHAHNCFRDLFQLIDLYENPEISVDEVVAKREDIDIDFLQADLDKLFASMKNGSCRIKDIVNGLRCFSGLDKAEYKTTHLHAGLESTLLMLEHHFTLNAGKRTIQVIKHYGDIPAIDCYPGALNQAFFNIISNAIDALEMAEDIFNPTITISTLQTDSQTVEITIMDNGPGIAEDIQNQIFTPFFTTKAVGQGTGLGLAIAHQIIVDTHGGTLNVQSAVGQGTEFYICLPI